MHMAVSTILTVSRPQRNSYARVAVAQYIDISCVSISQMLIFQKFVYKLEKSANYDCTQKTVIIKKQIILRALFVRKNEMH